MRIVFSFSAPVMSESSLRYMLSRVVASAVTCQRSTVVEPVASYLLSTHAVLWTAQD
jgi:hypothetical protein